MRPTAFAPKPRLRLIATLLLTTLAAQPSVGATAASSGYRVSATIMLGPPDRWDYLAFEPSLHRVYISHGDRISILDGLTGAALGEFRRAPGGTHGIAISIATGQGFTDDGTAGLVLPFDLATLKPKAPIPVGADADAIVADRASGRLFVVDGDPGTLSVIDPRTDKVIATIPCGGKLEFAVADGRGHLYVNGEAKHEIVRVDTKSLKVDAVWPMPACRSPHGLAIDEMGRRLFAGCANKTLTAIDTNTGEVVANLPIGAGNDGVAFDPRRKVVLATGGRDGILSLFRERQDGLVPAGLVSTAIGARTLAIDPETGRVFLVAGDTRPTLLGDGGPSARLGTVRLIVLDPVD